MDIDSVSYLYESPLGRFTIKSRLSGRWRVKHEQMPWGDSFPTPEAAARALSLEFPVPGDLEEWSEEGTYHTDLGGLQP